MLKRVYSSEFTCFIKIALYHLIIFWMIKVLWSSYTNTVCRYEAFCLWLCVKYWHLQYDRETFQVLKTLIQSCRYFNPFNLLPIHFLQLKVVVNQLIGLEGCRLVKVTNVLISFCNQNVNLLTIGSFLCITRLNLHTLMIEY